MTAREDAAWMALALAVARRAEPEPNPPVGAVVVERRGFVSLGWHERAGESHAEVIALKAAGARARGATLYVTLEPCNHHGRTPPCVAAVLAAGVARVVIGCGDPNPNVTGGGAECLLRSGVNVTIGTMGDEARLLIDGWARRHRFGAIGGALPAGARA